MTSQSNVGWMIARTLAARQRFADEAAAEEKAEAEKRVLNDRVKREKAEAAILDQLGENLRTELHALYATVDRTGKPLTSAQAAQKLDLEVKICDIKNRRSRLCQSN